ncbi:hypothetical protein IE53DRAFT_138849 [Violaceomyces palustris]|uniref:Uncharacterized protein n=1 Tax=Violaceomyces palustris TaxID=1673888 RepID=A0ACD0NUN6_9BASI|nr:hypothetical protein IE53DRAFT_138849 [Violaceomyces palustris]
MLVHLAYFPTTITSSKTLPSPSFLLLLLLLLPPPPFSPAPLRFLPPRDRHRPLTFSTLNPGHSQRLTPIFIPYRLSQRKEMIPSPCRPTLKLGSEDEITSGERILSSEQGCCSHITCRDPLASRSRKEVDEIWLCKDTVCMYSQDGTSPLPWR